MKAIKRVADMHQMKNGYCLLGTALLAAVSQGFAVTPVIVTQPTNQTVTAGTTAKFNVSVSGCPVPYYQWVGRGSNIPNGVTIAGLGTNGYGTGCAVQTPIGAAFGIFRDQIGNVFYTDIDHRRVMKISTNGFLSCVAGNGSADSSGDGGYATNAGIGTPYGVVLDKNANLYLSSMNHSRIRKVTPEGIISTFAGTGVGWWWAFTNGCYATNVGIGTPHGMAFDSKGNLYITEANSDHLLKIDTNQIVWLVAGGGADRGYTAVVPTNADLAWVRDVALDTEDNIYLACVGAWPNGTISRVCKIDTNNLLNVIAGTNYYFSCPNGITVDKNKNIFVTDMYASNIKRIAPNGDIAVVAGNGLCISNFSGTYSYGPQELKVDEDGNLYVAGWQAYWIYKVAP
jgi:sugar lactone lactonase YvrE